AGKITHVVTLSVDVTELKKAEALAIAAKEEAELANLAKSEFLANMSHELRTPLNAIIGFSEVMLSETFGPLNNTRYEDYVRDIHTSGDHLHKIISDLLDVARIEMGEIEFELVDIDVGQVLDSVRVMEMGKAENAGIALFDRTERPLPPVRGDAVRLRQIFINLIDNAIKFTEPGGRIELSATVVEGNRLAITVADTGIGIPVDDIDRVVEPFVRLHPSATNNASGTGLGLSLVKSLVELHGGEMTIDSEPGWGTQITVTLPCTKSSLRVVAAGRAIA
ncbi:MAG: HAMP domain-containing sensor histidine kinase, partial [Alphaproteobacteria bacterium]